MSVDPRHSAKLLASLAAVYVIWGSSFLFTKIGVTHLPGALFSGLRFMMAGFGLALLARFWRGNAWPTKRGDWRDILIMGLFTVVFSTGLNVWALRFISSGESALLNSTAALWIAVFGSFGARGHPLTRHSVLGLVLGVIGTALTLSPRLGGHSAVVIPYLVALAACLSWSVATMYYRHVDTQLGSLMFIGLQMLTGGIIQFIIGCAFGQWSQWSFNAPGMIALAYLTIFSSGIAYTAYGWLTRNTSPAVIGTYSYVNPALAAFMGWWLLHEQLLPIQFAGMLIVLVGVVLVTSKGTTPRNDKGLEEPASP